MTEVIGKMTELQYLRWKTKLDEVMLEKSYGELAGKDYENLCKDLEIVKLRVELSKTRVRDKALSVKEKKQKFDEFMEELKKELGFELKECVIDEFTYEVKKVQ